MTLVISKGITLRKGYNSAFADPDVQAYLTAVEAADGQALEYRTAVAIDEFVRGCKADGIWSAIKASCILAGARTLEGALVPLVGTAPTNNNFVSGDYDRKTGLVGDGSTKYLNSNRAGNADPQDNIHASVYIITSHNPAAAAGSAGGYVGNGGTSTGATSIIVAGGANSAFYNAATRNRNSTGSGLLDNIVRPTGFFGTTRIASGSYTNRTSATSYTINITSQTSATENFFVFARNNGSNSPAIFNNGRLAFYSIGESLNLALLDARVTDLINAFGAAIP